MGALKRLSVGVVLLALAIAVAQKQGLMPDQLDALHGRLLQQPVVAAAVGHLRALPWLDALLSRPSAGGCSCGVSGPGLSTGRAASIGLHGHAAGCRR